MPTLLQSRGDSTSSAFCVFGPPGLKSPSQNPARLKSAERESAFIVKNTFLEVPEEDHEDFSEEDASLSPFLLRRRRGSSFYRSASEPRLPLRIEDTTLQAAANLASHSHNVEAHDVKQPSRETTANVYDTETHCAYSQEQCHVNSQLGSEFGSVRQVVGMPQTANPAAGWCVDPHTSWVCHPPQMAGTLAANDTGAMTAAVYAGFHAGVMAALCANQIMPKAVESCDATSVRKSSPQIQKYHHDMARSGAGCQNTSRDQCLNGFGTVTVRDSEQNHLQSQQFNGLLAFPQSPHFDRKFGRTVRESISSCVSDASTTISIGASSLQDLRTSSSSPEPRAPCHLIWCDQRAFKEVSDSWKKQLEVATGIQVKTHKTSEKCIRLLRKKQHSQARPPCVFLVSWANAPTLLPFIEESHNITAKVILLCDTDMCRGRNRDAAERLASGYPFVVHLAACWADAVVTASRLVGEFQGLH